MAHGTCSIPGCGKTGVLTRTWCVNHYARYRRWGDPLGSKPAPRESCDVPGCTRKGKWSSGLCSTHAYRMRVHGDVLADVPVKEQIGVAECTVPGCGRRGYLRRGWCSVHYQRWEDHGDALYEPPKPTEACAVEECGKPHAARGWCGTHYVRWLRTGSVELALRPEVPPCAVEGCGSLRDKREWCIKHYARWKKYGDPLITQRERNSTPPETCTLDGCEQPHRAKGRCYRHYGQLKYLSNYEAITARHARHYRDNPEMYAVKSIVRRRQLAAVPLDKVDRLLSAEYRKAIRNDPCAYCGAPGVETDHFFPVNLGGTEHWWNLVRACRWCNRSKGAHCGTRFALKRGAVDESGIAAAVA
jgi:hypothetical protein